MDEEFRKEIRFAIVMYGGVSLAVYINGVVQEFLRLVRSTRLPLDQLHGSERVYRKISYLTDYTASMEDAERLLQDKQSKPHTCFIIDILSGTSAGGINGIFLAKALATGGSIDELQKLWVTEADFSLLLNDRGSSEGVIRPQDPPSSLLNSQRIYRKLLDAFDGMRLPLGEPLKEPLVHDLDLFVTTTDLTGLVLPIQLADKRIFERRHRNVFHFRLRNGQKDGHDFVDDNNPFLAFAARSTSAFPFAFEPMKLSDIDAVLNTVPAYAGNEDCGADSKRWKKFYRDYDPDQTRSAVTAPVPFPERPLADGGYLDNKPFTYIAETLKRRNASIPIERKLIYVEPSPDHPEREVESSAKPNALENSAKALLLPGDETIREDLQRLQEQNRLLVRVNRIIRGIERDIEEWLGQGSNKRAAADVTDEEWAALGLEDLIARYDYEYALPYHRLEIASVSDDLARTFAKLVGIPEEADSFAAVRYLISAWRDKRYVDYAKDDRKRPTMNRFLYEFNVSYVLRRLRFISSKADDFYRLDEHAIALVKKFAGGPDAWDEPLQTEFKREILRIKRSINDMHNKILDFLRKVASLKDSPVLAVFTRDVIKDEDIRYILGSNIAEAEGTAANPINEQAVSRARDLLKDGSPLLQQFDEAARLLINGPTGSDGTLAVRRQADTECRALFSEKEEAPIAPKGRNLARKSLRHYYELFPHYDMVGFQMLYGTSAAEAEIVQVMRVSPYDADSLISEEKTRCSKLAGVQLGHFGAFLKRSWRENDILWGRLDGAERIIRAVLPGRPETEVRRLIGEVHAEIILEVLEKLGAEERIRLLVECARRTRNGQPDPGILEDFVDSLLKNAPLDLRNELAGKVVINDLRGHYDKTFKTEGGIGREDTARLAARSATVVGRMFDVITAGYGLKNTIPATIARVGKVAWWVVETAVPGNESVFLRHWLALVWMLELSLLLLALITGRQEVTHLALQAIAVTGAATAGVFALSAWILRQTWPRQLAAVCGGVIAFAGLALAVRETQSHLAADIHGLASPAALRKILEGDTLFLLLWVFATMLASILNLAFKGLPSGSRSNRRTLLSGTIRDIRNGLDKNQQATIGESVGKEGLSTITRYWRQFISRRNLEFELASSGAAVQDILMTKKSSLFSLNRSAFKLLTRADYFFIAGYWLYFGGLSVLPLAKAGAHVWFSLAGLLTITMTAIFDLFENRGMLIACDMKSDSDYDEIAQIIRTSGTLKWSFFFGNMLLLGTVVLLNGGGFQEIRWLDIAAAIPLVSAGILGGVGLTSKRLALIRTGMLFAGLVPILLTILWLVWRV